MATETTTVPKENQQCRLPKEERRGALHGEDQKGTGKLEQIARDKERGKGWTRSLMRA